MAERTKPVKFIVHGVSLHIIDKGKDLWVAEVYWDKKDGCFVLESSGPGNWDFAPCDLEELARVMRALPREPGVSDGT